MTEEERTQAGRRLERRLQELDAHRLDRINGSYRAERIFKAILLAFMLAGILASIALGVLK